MPIFNLSDHGESNFRIAAPICFIGGGIAGLLAARKIAGKGRRVIVVESGTEAFAADIHALNEIEDPFGRYTRSMTGRYRGFGGTSARWGGRMLPISRHETDARPHLSLPGWPSPIDRLGAYESEIEELFCIGSDTYEAIGTPDFDIAEPFRPGSASLIPRWAKCPSFKRCNVATILRDQLRRMPGIEIWLDATVCGFELDRAGGRLRAVTACNLHGRKLTVEAEHFVLTAGTIETTRLLLLLDRASGERAFGRCDALGRYFQDHLKAEIATIDRRDPVRTNALFGYRFVHAIRRDLHLELSQAAQRKDAVASAFVYVSMDVEQGPLADVKKLAHGLQRRELDVRAMQRVARNVGFLTKAAYWRAFRRQLYVPREIDLRLFACVEQLPNRNNRIELAERRDRMGVPKVSLDWSPTAADEKSFRSSVAHLDAYWRQTGFDRVCPLIWTAGAGVASTRIVDRSEACAHPSGSTRMGTDPTNSVVGPDLRCHAVPNVAVVSASVFPTAGSANPTFTIMKLALWFADDYLRVASAGAPAARVTTLAG